MAATSPSFLDRSAMRAVALLCLMLAVLAFGYVHRDELFPPSTGTASADDPLDACIAERAAEIDQMRDEGSLTPAQARASRNRLDGVCRAEVGLAAPTMPPLPQ